VERLVFVHGSVRNGEAAWAAQRPLAVDYELVVLNRPGYPPNRPEERIDFEEQASWVAERLTPGDHLCGHSYGGVVSLYAAGVFSELASLTVLEPPAFGLAVPPRTSSPGDSPLTGSTAPTTPAIFCSGSMRLLQAASSSCPIRSRPNWSRASER
jgi:pimeloyl-ACP methyl ester carboxylesterase